MGRNYKDFYDKLSFSEEKTVETLRKAKKMKHKTKFNAGSPYATLLAMAMALVIFVGGGALLLNSEIFSPADPNGDNGNGTTDGIHENHIANHADIDAVREFMYRNYLATWAPFGNSGGVKAEQLEPFKLGSQDYMASQTINGITLNIIDVVIDYNMLIVFYEVVAPEDFSFYRKNDGYSDFLVTARHDKNLTRTTKLIHTSWGFNGYPTENENRGYFYSVEYTINGQQLLSERESFMFRPMGNPAYYDLPSAPIEGLKHLKTAHWNFDIPLNGYAPEMLTVEVNDYLFDEYNKIKRIEFAMFTATVVFEEWHSGGYNEYNFYVEYLDGSVMRVHKDYGWLNTKPYDTQMVYSFQTSVRPHSVKNIILGELDWNYTNFKDEEGNYMPMKDDDGNDLPFVVIPVKS